MTYQQSNQKRPVGRLAMAAAMLVVVALGAACGPKQAWLGFTPSPALAQPLVFYDWDGDLPESVLEAFTREYNVEVIFRTYLSQEEAIQNLRAGQAYDVVVMESRFIPLLAREGLVAAIDYGRVPNYINISPSFRNLQYDPENRYCIPFNWGTTGLVVRTDLAEAPVTRWADLWDSRYAGKVAIWVGQTREVIGIALKSLGYSANSEKPEELQAALTHLLALKPNVVYVEDASPDNAGKALASGKIIFSMGYAGDILASRDLNLPVQYVLPEEGALLWGDTFVIPAKSPNKAMAEVFLNYLLRPEVSAQIANATNYATANEAALPFIRLEILQDPVIYPPPERLRQGEIILPISAEGQKMYDELWAKFRQSAP
jgi:spermidine/putrescine transport system substrate-binding protein